MPYIPPILTEPKQSQCIPILTGLDAAPNTSNTFVRSICLDPRAHENVLRGGAKRFKSALKLTNCPESPTSNKKTHFHIPGHLKVKSRRQGPSYSNT
eukprot:3925563-Prymnesium_polylepis.1